jgi:hypothetical protein
VTDRLLTTRQVAAMLGVSTETVLRWRLAEGERLRPEERSGGGGDGDGCEPERDYRPQPEVSGVHTVGYRPSWGGA